ncbi:hypothetical protein K439DRAFT_1634449 [Ramaria rubella]|nr:hypothetical protein K439DRAFT_1634449 [Ramaria rubella]
MKLSEAFSILIDLTYALKLAFLPTLIEIVKSPRLLFSPHNLSHLFFHNVWTLFGNGANQASYSVKTELISPNAHGVVLDLGAGHGHTVPYLSTSRVSKYVAIEPNVLMHPKIRDTAVRAGFSEESDTLIILSCGAEDVATISSALGGQHQVDTIVSVLTLCSVPSPQRTIERLVIDILKPGGQLLFYEHVASKRRDVRWWQGFWSPLWKTFFDGCVLYRPTDDYIRHINGIWEAFPTTDASGRRTGIWARDEDDIESLFWYQVGRLIKSKE